jgi:hypothetical protein
VQFAPDRRQGDVHDRQVDDGHKERDGQHRERAPAMDGGHDRLPKIVVGGVGYRKPIGFLRSNATIHRRK